MSARLQSSEGLAEAVGPGSKAFHLRGGKLVLAVDRRPWFLALWTTPQVCLSNLVTWQPASLGMSDSREIKEEITMSFMTVLGF